VATWLAGIRIATTATAFSGATAAAQSDLLPSGAVTSTTGMSLLMPSIFGILRWFFASRLSISAQ
jgi:UPF0716 family protein affecting phage T7 exclusion